MSLQQSQINDLGARYIDITTSSNSSQIIINSSDIDSLETDVIQLITDLDTAELQIVQNTTDIKTNTDQLVINTPQIITNTGDIGTNTTDIKTNTDQLVINSPAIIQNTTDIKTNFDQLAINTPLLTSTTATANGNVITINNQGTDILALQNNYVVQVLAGNWTSGNASVALNVQFARYLDMCSFRVDLMTGTNSAGAAPSYDYDTVVSTTFRPSSTLHFVITSLNNGTTTIGVCTLDSSGNLKIFRDIDQTTDYGTAVVTGSQAFSKSYNIES